MLTEIEKEWLSAAVKMLQQIPKSIPTNPTIWLEGGYLRIGRSTNAFYFYGAFRGLEPNKKYKFEELIK